MTHDLFGKLKYKERDEQWVGYARLPLFAAIGARPPEEPLTEEQATQMIADMNLAMENMRNMMREKFGDKVDAAFEQFDREADEMQRKAGEEADAPDPSGRHSPASEARGARRRPQEEEERERKQQEREKKRAARLAKGHFPIGISAMPGDKPKAKQAAALQFLIDNEQVVYDAVLAQVWESFQAYYDQEHWRRIAAMKPAESVADLAGRFAVTRLDITRESRGGFAHLVFVVDSDWQDEHGLLVVYSPDTREAAWTSWDILGDLTESDDPADKEEEYVPTPHDELVDAIREGDEKNARKLVAAGADINALGPDEYPPLWVAVDQMEVGEVRRLLAFGADPNLANPDEKTTPLKHAKKLYKEMGFAPSKKKDKFLDSILSLAREAGGKQFDEMRVRLEEIIKLLEDAGK
jgi:hypothetical protein